MYILVSFIRSMDDSLLVDQINDIDLTSTRAVLIERETADQFCTILLDHLVMPDGALSYSPTKNEPPFVLKFFTCYVLFFE